MKSIITKLKQSRARKLRSRMVYTMLLIVIFCLGLFTLWFNKGFYYADYQSGITLQFADITPDTFFDQFSGAKYVSKVNRQTKQVRYQGLTLPQVNGVIQDLSTKPTQVVQQSQNLPTDIPIRVLWIGLVSFFVTTAFIYYTVIRKGVGIKVQLTGWTLFKLIGFGIGIVSYLGVLSLVSRIYQLTDTSLLGILVGGLVGLVLVFSSIQSILNHQSKANTIYNLELQTVPFTKALVNRIWKLALLAILFISIGMGVNFAFDGLLIWVGIIIVSFSVLLLPEFLIIAWYLEWGKLYAPDLNNAVVVNELANSLPLNPTKKLKYKTAKPKSKRRR